MRRLRGALVLALCACSASTEVRDAATDIATDACTPGDGLPVHDLAAPHPRQQACTSDEIDGYFAACLDEARALPIQCQQFVAAHGACVACLNPTDGPAGALFASRGEVRLNVGGCISLVLGDLRPDGCGVREQRAIDCAAAACAPCVDDPACPTRVRSGVCAAYEPPRCPELAGAAMCALDGTFEARYQRVARVFCTL